MSIKTLTSLNLNRFIKENKDFLQNFIQSLDLDCAGLNILVSLGSFCLGEPNPIGPHYSSVDPRRSILQIKSAFVKTNNIKFKSLYLSSANHTKNQAFCVYDHAHMKREKIALF